MASQAEKPVDKSQPLEKKEHSTAETLVESLSGLDLGDEQEKHAKGDQLNVHDEENGGFGGRKRVNTEDVNCTLTFHTALINTLVNPSDTSPPVDYLKGEPLACIFVARYSLLYLSNSDAQLECCQIRRPTH